MGGKNLALYTLKPNVAVSISGRLNTCRVLNFQVQAVSCTVSLMQGCNHTVTIRHTPTPSGRNGRFPLFGEAWKWFPSSWPSPWFGKKPSCIELLHAMATSKRQSEERGSQQWLWPAREPRCLWGKRGAQLQQTVTLPLGAHPGCATSTGWQLPPMVKGPLNHKGAQCRTAQLLKMLLRYGTALLPPASCSFCPTNLLATCFSWERALNVLSLAGKLCDAIIHVFWGGSKEKC